MPRTAPMTPALADLLCRQDGVVTVDQLERHGVARNAADKRVARGGWHRLLPGVLLTGNGMPSRRQLLVAAWLWGGAGAAIDGLDALRWYGYDGDGSSPRRVHVVVESDAPTRSAGFAVVRRAMAEIRIGDRGLVPYVDAGTAAVVAARNAHSSRAAVGVLSRALQQGLVTASDLREARERIGDKWCRPVDGALVAVGVGVRSPAENDFRRLVLTSRVMAEPAWNRWLRLPDGGPEVCVDALWDQAGMVGEVIGKRYHAWGEQYDETNARKERLQAAGLVVCEATPTRIRRQGPRCSRTWSRSTWPMSDAACRAAS